MSIFKELLQRTRISQGSHVDALETSAFLPINSTK